ncbi:MAG TPA: polymer-forming cytoskeletal protein [Pyrinomonadaceae bacterium]|jgi:cytoskeletal protein CcmA (bactofilin family)
MPQAKPSLNGDLAGQTVEENDNLSTSRRSVPVQFPATRKAKVIAKFQPRRPVIIGEAAYTGMMAVEGGLCGQLGANGGAIDVRQRTRSTQFGSGPELNGELIFKDILRVNGHIAGYVQSLQGTLIVDSTARVDANVDVAVAVIGGVVNGDIVAHQRVELGPEARINGNIWTQSIAIQPGAIFEGVCRMLKNEEAVE